MLDINKGSVDNLRSLFALADEIDIEEGKLAYDRYHVLLHEIARKYRQPFYRVVAGFVAMSPNNDYFGNLRSLVTVLDAIQHGRDQDSVNIATYRHCMVRAWAYLDGSANFLATARGPKIRSFYRNIIDPSDPVPVTVDGHIVAAWVAEPLVMKDAIIQPRFYEQVAQAVRDLATENGLLANQAQATVWFTRKRVLRVRYEPQVDIFHHSNGNVWQTLVDLDAVEPYPPRSEPLATASSCQGGTAAPSSGSSATASSTQGPAASSGSGRRHAAEETPHPMPLFGSRESDGSDTDGRPSSSTGST